jgi:trimeric autotransporter adhesin
LFQNTHVMKTTRLLTSLLAATLIVAQACDSDTPDPSGKINIPTTPGNIETIAGQGPTGFGNDGDGGLATSAKVGWVVGVATDKANNVYITDGAANVVRKISASTGNISTIAGNGTSGYSGDGGAATAAQLNVALASAVDGDDNVLIVDGSNNVLRMVSSSDGKIATIAGSGAQGYSGDGGLAKQATFWNLYSVTVDAAGNIYLADAGNNVIRKITKSTGIITTIAGLGPDQAGYSGDNGQATAAKLNTPHGVTVDKDGNVYIADDANHVVRKISNGVITTFAGNGSVGNSGDGGLATQAKFSSVTRVAVDSEGNVYIADGSSNVVRKVTISTGIISTIAGNGTAGYTGDGGSATQAEISNPWDVTVDSNGNVFIADTQNAAIRVVSK